MTAELVVLNTSLDFAISAWLEAKTQRSNSSRTATEYANTMRSFRDACQASGTDLDGDIYILKLLLQAWAGHSRKGKTVSASSYNLRLAIVSSFYSYCLKGHLASISANPVTLVDRKPIQSYAAAMPLSAKGVRAALKAIDRTSPVGKRDYALLSVALSTGRRVAELAAMTVGDVFVEGDRVMIVWPRTKGAKVMRDTLSVTVGKALLDYLHTAYGELSTVSADAPVWISDARNSNRGGPLGSQGIAKLCAKRLGVSKSHVLRHTFAHNLEEAGAKLSEIQARLGHASAATTSKYLVALRSDENPYSEQLAAMFGVE